MRIAPRLYDELIAHAQAESPNECVGLLGIRDVEVVQVLRASNAMASPFRFEICVEEQVRLQTLLEDQRLGLGIYHSHPRSSAYPSHTDIVLASYPSAVYVIVSLLGAPEVRAFRIQSGRVAEVELHVG